MNSLWNEKQMSLLWKCNQTSFEVPGRSIFANQEILNLKKQMLIRFCSKHVFHRKPWVTFLLWWHSKFLICLGNLFPKWHSEWLLPLPASWVLRSLPSMSVLWLFSFSSTLLLDITMEAAHNNGVYGLNRGSIHGARGCRHCQRLYCEQRERPRVSLHWTIWFSFLKCMLMTIMLSHNLGLQFHLNSSLAPQAVGKVIFNIARLHLEYSEGR